MNRYLRLWWAFFVQALRRDLQFRTQTLVTAITAVTDLGLSLLPVLIVVHQTGSASPWTGALATAVVGAYGMATAIIHAFVAPNLGRMDHYVREGELDLVLVRPVHAPWFTTLRWIAPAELWGLLTGGALLMGGLAAAGVRPALVDVLAAAGWMGLGIVAFTLFWANLSYLAFWFSSAEPVTYIANGLLSAGQYPRVYFARAARTVFATIIPAGLVAAVPVEALLGRAAWGWLGLGVLLVLVALALTLTHWHLALRRYESASS